jgi:uncharacterized protein (UPF0332 family)
VSQKEVIAYWLEKADQDLASARGNLSAGRLQNCVRDAYFACFHAFSAVLISTGETFRKHSEVRSILHREYVKGRKLAVEWGKHYDWLFDNRQKADYRPLVDFDIDQVKDILEKSEGFVREMKSMTEGGSHFND